MTITKEKVTQIQEQNIKDLEEIFNYDEKDAYLINHRTINKERLILCIQLNRELVHLKKTL